VARIDFLVDIKKEKIYLNEINTLPGALAFYLWEASGLKSSDFLDRLICLGFDRFQNRNKINFSFDSGLFSGKRRGSKI
jgi:D-alanine-D-alanine ligase